MNSIDAKSSDPTSDILFYRRRN